MSSPALLAIGDFSRATQHRCGSCGMGRCAMRAVRSANRQVNSGTPLPRRTQGWVDSAVGTMGTPNVTAFGVTRLSTASRVCWTSRPRECWRLSSSDDCRAKRPSRRRFRGFEHSRPKFSVQPCRCKGAARLCGLAPNPINSGILCKILSTRGVSAPAFASGQQRLFSKSPTTASTRRPTFPSSRSNVR
jgi:hypothetical protein